MYYHENYKSDCSTSELVIMTSFDVRTTFIKYMSQIIKTEVFTIEEARVKTFSQFQRSRNNKKLRLFLGLNSFYQIVFPIYINIFALLTRLL